MNRFGEVDPVYGAPMFTIYPPDMPNARPSTTMQQSPRLEQQTPEKNNVAEQFKNKTLLNNSVSSVAKKKSKGGGKGESEKPKLSKKQEKKLLAEAAKWNNDEPSVADQDAKTVKTKKSGT